MHQFFEAGGIVFVREAITHVEMFGRLLRSRSIQEWLALRPDARRLRVHFAGGGVADLDRPDDITEFLAKFRPTLAAAVQCVDSQTNPAMAIAAANDYRRIEANTPAWAVTR